MFQKFVHVRRRTALSKVPGMRMVSGFVDDPMHTIDGGVFVDVADRFAAEPENEFKERRTQRGVDLFIAIDNVVECTLLSLN